MIGLLQIRVWNRNTYRNTWCSARLVINDEVFVFPADYGRSARDEALKIAKGKVNKLMIEELNVKTKKELEFEDFFDIDF